MSNLYVTSEIAPLKSVLLHRPGMELENLTPKWLEQLLFDDIPWLNLARKEHDEFASVFRENGVQVLYLSDLVSETLDQNPVIKAKFIQQFLDEAPVTSESLRQVLTDYLNTFKSTKSMVEMTMAGIRKSEVPHFVKRTLSDYIRDYPFVTDPMPNLYFTRDPFSVIASGVAISKMYTTTRSRESIYGDYIFKYHPVYGHGKTPIYYERDYLSTIEGGDIVILNTKTLAIGVSQRTHPAAIEKIAKNLFYNHQTPFDTIIAFDIPKSRSFMHLDTVFTQVDHGKFLVHHEVQREIKAFELTRSQVQPGKLKVIPIEEKLKDILEKYVQVPVTLIVCGGDDVVASDREQWNDGANTIAIRPGEVIVYERNHITNHLLEKHGVKIHTIRSSELSRGRGGPRCMSMPFERESI
ncbi:MAG: arginine deiminase [Candidatus Izemoplasmatales bacterium]|jgi:arginine deiminase|nr:arginine deiminase [Candidatus Izemoplasmatales bacterium]NLF49094.1 arginine deiminase [Acholeplasmataceae bacterium]MDD4355046.1 arginine deiminase [Candidatus Izemoplasmatales bacterium]MDD4987891.1 arginine deiminase [Candidatus Izemoplasmatales bacterium]MDD5601899.1 arginine deiminase [Candidatus Izemoplasmatales bacterium]